MQAAAEAPLQVTAVCELGKRFLQVVLAAVRLQVVPLHLQGYTRRELTVCRLILEQVAPVMCEVSTPDLSSVQSLHRSTRCKMQAFSCFDLPDSIRPPALSGLAKRVDSQLRSNSDRVLAGNIPLAGSSSNRVARFCRLK